MNFSFEGNHRPKRNINLGGVKSHDDKRSLLLKLQNERKAREEERRKLKNTIRIQSFYRSRKEVGLLHGEQMKDFEQLLQMKQTVSSLLTLTRELLQFYPSTQNTTLLTKYLVLMIQNDFEWTRFMLAIEDAEVLDTWIWQVCLVVKKVLLPSLFTVQETQVWLNFLTSAKSYKTHATHTRIITFIILNTPCFEIIRNAAVSTISPNKKYVENILVDLITLSPPFEFPDSPIRRFLPPPPRKFGGLFSGNTTVVEEPPVQNTHFLSRDALVEKMVTKLLVQPFLLESLASSVATSIARHFPFKVILDTTRQCVINDPTLTDQQVAGLLMNVSVISTLDSGEHLEGVLPSYAETIQVLLSRLPVLSLESDQDKTNIKQESDSSDDSSSDEDENDVQDVEMKEAPPVLSEEIKACLATLYSPDKISHLLHQFAQQATLHANDLNVVGSISSFFNTLMLRWPAKKEQVLNTILYKSKEYRLIPLLYQAWSSTNEARLFNGDAINSQLTPAIASFSQSPNSWSILYLLNELYTRFLLTLADMEFLDKTANNMNHLPLSQVIDLSRQLKNIAFVLFWRANSMSLDQTVGFAAIRLHQLRSSATHLLQHIHMRDSRRPFCPMDHWLIKDLDTHGFSSDAVAEEFNLESESAERRHYISKSRLAVVSPRLGLLNNIPFVIPFEQRVEIFRMFVENDKKRNQVDLFRHSEASKIRRHHMFDDGFNAFQHMGEGFKNRVAITFVDDFGLEEAGIDGGGVFKEFLTGLSHEAFNESNGLFVTTSEQLLYPNPNSYATKPLEQSYFEFLGLMIGKAVYEGILLDVAFAEFFLKKCLGKVNYLDDLASLDPELYKGLLNIKNFTGNVQDLSLDFTVTRHDGKTIELVPDGSNIPVTNQNRLQYIYAVADYKLNKQISKQCRAFFNGLSTIIDIKWLRMFNQQELQILLGGASVPIDLNDLRQNTLYARYTESDKTIQNFWKALESFDNEHRMKFVKFVTSCSRPPLLGFKELVPKFCIGNAGATDDRLPTSSTCVNLLKLPDFSSFEILKSKLMYAITADAGFDLS